MELNDAELARQWQNGDGKAAAILVERYTDALGAVAFSILGDLSVAEEAVQEAFARASRQVRRLDAPDRVGAWLAGIVRHVALDQVRRRSRERPCLGTACAENLSARSDPAGDASRAETIQRVQEAVNKLPDDQREVFSMKYLAGMSYADIGRALGMTPDAVGQKLWRVRRKLQQQLKELLA